jgi:putative ABC transport system permease protein
MITLYVANEMSYDNYHVNANRIFRVAQHATWDGGRFDLAVTPAPMTTKCLRMSFEVEETVRFDAEGGGTILSRISAYR